MKTKTSAKTSSGASTKSSHRASYNLRRTLIAGLVSAAFGHAMANPVAPTVINGIATFNQQGGVYTVTNTPNAIINWQSFSISPGEIARFIQQGADSKVLNRIIGQDPSQILGSLQSNGKIFLINPNGVIFGAGSRVDANGLVASSLNLTNADFLAGKNIFSANGIAGTPGNVSNQGTITTPSGGQVFLIAPNVENTGIITAPNGDVMLAAGRNVQLFDSSDPNLHVVVSAPSDQAINIGSIVAAGGRAGVFGALVNQRGVINADSATRGVNGKIVLKASGTTLVESSSVTTAKGMDQNTGGDIMVLGNKVGVTGNAVIDASGEGGGGTVLIGGDYQGKNAAVVNAEQTYLGQDATVRADATANGNGGKVILWSDRATTVLGSVSARGGADGGNGGFVETSGKYLDMRGQVDTRAPRGTNGMLLLDPSDIYIASSASNAYSSGMIDGSPLSNNGGIFQDTAAVQDSLLLTGVLNTALQNTNVTVSTANGNGTGTGSIFVVDPVTWTSTHSLTLQANSNIALNASINGSSGALNLSAGGNIVQSVSPSDGLTVASLTASAGAINLQNTANSISGQVTLSSTLGGINLSGTSFNLGTVDSAGDFILNSANAINATGAVSVAGLFDLQSGNWIQSAATLPSFSAHDFRISGGSFMRIAGGNGSSGSPYRLTDVYGLQGVGSLPLDKSYVLNNDIDASATANWTGGFAPIARASVFSGNFEGAGHQISGLTISRPGDDNVGLFAAVSTGTISNLTLSDVNVTGQSNVGGAVGFMASGSIAGVTVGGHVGGVGNVGALVGSNLGVITQSRSTGTVNGFSGANASNIGGLVGRNAGQISASSSSVAVSTTGDGYAGGLVGSNTRDGGSVGAISQSFSSGNVYSSGEIVGGLVGDNRGGTVNQSYSTGNVNGGRNVGGLAGRNADNGVIDTAYATGNVQGNQDYFGVSHGNIGGLLGDLNSGTVSNVYSSGTVSNSGFFNVYGMVGSVEGGSLSNAYFNQTAAGTPSDAAGGTPLTAEEMRKQASYGSLDFANTWRIYDDYTTPLLKLFLTPVTVTVTGGSQGVIKTYDGQAAAFAGSVSGVPSSGVNGTYGFGSSPNVGTYSLGGLWSTTYDISYSGNTSAQAVIQPRTVTATVSGTKVYDGVDYLEIPATFTFNNMVNGDSLGIEGLVRYDNKNVGSTKTLNVTNPQLTGNGFGNYVLSGGVSGTGSITPADLVVSGVAVNTRPYDGTTVATLNGAPTVTALANDQVNISLIGSGNANFIDPNVGASKPVIVNANSFALSGTDAGNYNLIAPEGLTGEITAAPIVVSPPAVPVQVPTPAPTPTKADITTAIQQATNEIIQTTSSITASASGSTNQGNSTSTTISSSTTATKDDHAQKTYCN